MRRCVRHAPPQCCSRCRGEKSAIATVACRPASFGQHRRDMLEVEAMETKASITGLVQLTPAAQSGWRHPASWHGRRCRSRQSAATVGAALCIALIASSPKRLWSGASSRSALSSSRCVGVEQHRRHEARTAVHDAVTASRDVIDCDAALGECREDGIQRRRRGPSMRATRARSPRCQRPGRPPSGSAAACQSLRPARATGARRSSNSANLSDDEPALRTSTRGPAESLMPGFAAACPCAGCRRRRPASSSHRAGTARRVPG